MQPSKQWADLIQNSMDDSASLAHIHRQLVGTIKEIKSDVLASCMQIAIAQVGAAEKQRIKRGFKFSHLSEFAAEAIRDEERGEKIAAEEIRAEIQRLIDQVNRE